MHYGNILSPYICKVEKNINAKKKTNICPVKTNICPVLLKLFCKEELQMKEKYVELEMQVIVLQETDIVTLSSDDFYDNGENDQVWG